MNNDNLLTFKEYRNKNLEKFQGIYKEVKELSNDEQIYHFDGSIKTVESMLAESYENYKNIKTTKAKKLNCA